MSLRLTAAELKRLQERRGKPAAPSIPAGPKLARGRPVERKMNKTEAAYAGYLRGLELGGEVLWHGFEAITLRLADGTTYTPDFAVLPAADQVLELHEVKGFWRDDARVKIKVAAGLFPFRFLAVTREGGRWRVERF